MNELKNLGNSCIKRLKIGDGFIKFGLNMLNTLTYNNNLWYIWYIDI